MAAPARRLTRHIDLRRAEGTEPMKSLCVFLMLLAAAGVARAENWVALREPPETGESAPAGVSVDSSSIEIDAAGIRRAKVKLDFLSRRTTEKFGPRVLDFVIWSISYDCGREMKRDDASEYHWVDGSVKTVVTDKTLWLPAHRAADPSFDFVCRGGA